MAWRLNIRIVGIHGNTLTFPNNSGLITAIMSSINNLSAQQLRQAANLKEQIAGLEKQLSQLLGSTVTPVIANAVKKTGGMSAAGRARIVAAQKARWAKIKGMKSAVSTTQPAKPVKKKSTMSAAAKAKISAAAKARWAKMKAAKK